jgi:hypothetical protein
METEWIISQNIFCGKENVAYICIRFNGRLAQLVQSICLTSRGSAVRTRHRPQPENRTRLSGSGFIFNGHSGLTRIRTLKIKPDSDAEGGATVFRIAGASGNGSAKLTRHRPQRNNEELKIFGTFFILLRVKHG